MSCSALLDDSGVIKSVHENESGLGRCQVDMLCISRLHPIFALQL